MIRALIADDEAPARDKLRSLLAAEHDVELVGEAADGEQAVALVRELSPDVVFLDVQMPKRDGFGVVEEVGVEAMPLTVFVTAYDEHALRAFEVHALDYLLKPFAPARFRRMLARVRERLSAPGGDQLADHIARLVAEREEREPLRRLLARRGEDRQAFVPVEEIALLRADGNYVRILTRKGEELRRRDTVSHLAERLGSQRFLQINRSEIVAYDAIAELQPWFHGDWRVILRNGTKLMWSRRFRKKSEG